MSSKKENNEQKNILDEILDQVTDSEYNKTKQIMILAAKLADFVKERGMTKKEFAQKLGKKPSEISKWLSGTHNLTHATMIDIAEVLGITVSQLTTVNEENEFPIASFTIPLEEQIVSSDINIWPLPGLKRTIIPMSVFLHGAGTQIRTSKYDNSLLTQTIRYEC